MKIAVIGAGNVGAALSRAAVQAGHAVTIAAVHPEHAATVAADTGAVAAASSVDAVTGTDVVVLAVPGSAVASVAGELAGAVSGQVVVDATNPLNDSVTDLVIQGASAAEDLQALLPGVPVVKAFNTVFAARHANPTEQGDPLDAYYAGDDEAAKATVAAFAASLGFHPIDAGGLRMARALEEMVFLNITLNAAIGWSWQSAWKLVGPTG